MQGTSSRTMVLMINMNTSIHSKNKMEARAWRNQAIRFDSSRRVILGCRSKWKHNSDRSWKKDRTAECKADSRLSEMCTHHKLQTGWGPQAHWLIKNWKLSNSLTKTSSKNLSAKTWETGVPWGRDRFHPLWINSITSSSLSHKCKEWLSSLREWRWKHRGKIEDNGIHWHRVYQDFRTRVKACSWDSNKTFRTTNYKTMKLRLSISIFKTSSRRIWRSFKTYSKAKCLDNRYSRQDKVSLLRMGL